MQNIKPLINKQNIAEQSIILPYIQRRQRSVINANYFAIEGGSSASSSDAYDPSFSNKDGDFKVTVNLGGSDWVTPLQNIDATSFLAVMLSSITGQVVEQLLKFSS